jgi:hypothetical protein
MVRTARLQAELWKSKTVQEQNNTTAKAMDKNTKKKRKKRERAIETSRLRNDYLLECLGNHPEGEATFFVRKTRQPQSHPQVTKKGLG